MPKDTFFNLPPAKKELIEAAALDEFAAWGFDNASINRIVAATGIAKGSFYQYFADKTDLFRHLITRTTEQKRDFLSPILLNPQAHDFFTLLTELYRSGLAFARANPQAARVGNLVFKNRELPVYREILADGKATASGYYEELLRLAIARGEVRVDINIRFVAFLLYTLSLAIFDFYFEAVREDDFDMTAIGDDVLDMVQMTLDFVKNGIAVGNMTPAPGSQ
jgi:AcrR family transcriptional regulator